MMDSILEIPMSAVLEGLPLNEDAKRLLLEHEGDLAPVYELVAAVESGMWNLVVDSCGALNLQEDFAAACYSQAIEWAQSLTVTV